MRQLKAVIFDLDGTLIDSIDDLADSMNTVLKSLGYPRHETESYKHMVGDGVRSLVERALLDTARDEATVELCLDKFKEEYKTRWADKTRPYEGIPDVLNRLEARNIRMNILSNKIDHFTKLTVSRFFPRNTFDFVMGAIWKTRICGTSMGSFGLFTFTLPPGIRSRIFISAADSMRHTRTPYSWQI